MATNDNAQPLLVAGKLPKTCYTDLDEFVQDLSKVLALPLDAVAVIQGAEGKQGPKGATGSKGEQGPVGPGVTKSELHIPIPAGVTFVEFDVFFGWETAIYGIRNIGQHGSLNADVPVFDPAIGIVGPGTTVGVFNGTATAALPPARLRHYFVFAGGTPAITATPDNKFLLQITKFQ